MTTKVIVEACLADTKEVKVSIKTGALSVEGHTLQDGESGEYYVHDDRVITVKEVEK